VTLKRCWRRRIFLLRSRDSIAWDRNIFLGFPGFLSWLLDKMKGKALRRLFSNDNRTDVFGLFFPKTRRYTAPILGNGLGKAAMFVLL
jgi:hypothetical protein